MKSKMKLLLCLVIAGLTFSLCATSCKKKSHNDSTNSGGGNVPSGEQPFTGDAGNLGGTWTGKNATGGETDIVVENGFITGADLNFVCPSSVSSKNLSPKHLAAKTFIDGIAIDSTTGKFDGFLGSFQLSGSFSSDKKVFGVIDPASPG